MSKKFKRLFSQKSIRVTVHYTAGGSNLDLISGEELYQAFKERLLEELTITPLQLSETAS